MEKSSLNKKVNSLPKKSYSTNDLLNMKIDSKRSTTWFCDVWKPCIKEFDSEGQPIYFTDSNGYEYKGCDWYDDLDEKLREWELTHQGCKWAYVIHEKGHTMFDYSHEECEHKHFVLTQTNASTGKAIRKHFPNCHIAINYTRVENCALYLLHLSPGAIQQGKKRIPMDDLYCSGKGSHGQVWFPLMSSIEYETFVSSECLHLVYNEGMTTLIQFITRFGSSVCHGAYLSIIKTCIDQHQQMITSKSNVKEIFNLLSKETQFHLLKTCRCNSFDDVFEDRNNFRPPFVMDFQRIYIWLHNTWRDANEELLLMFKEYGLNCCFDENQKRIDTIEMANKNSIYGEHEE